MSPVPSSLTLTPLTHPLQRNLSAPRGQHIPHTDLLPKSLLPITPPCILPEEMYSFPCPHGSGFTHFPPPAPFRPTRPRHLRHRKFPRFTRPTRYMGTTRYIDCQQLTTCPRRCFLQTLFAPSIVWQP